MTDAGSAPAPAPASPLVGRERELAALRAALSTVLARRGSLVLIGGEAGIGKTALAEALCAEAAVQGALVLVGRCYDLTETPPYGPWAEALARVPHAEGLPPRPDPAGGSAGSQAALFAQVLAYVSTLAARRSLVLLLDDLHWADPASLDLLRFLGRQLADLSLLLLATYRADELTRRHAFYQLLPTLEREAHAARLDLRPLGEDALRALVGRYAMPPGDAARLVAWLLVRAEGNAFFTAQLLRALEDEGTLREGGDGWVLGNLGAVGLPTPLRQVLDARVDRLGEDARARLAMAAVIGQAVPLTLWTAVAGTDDDGMLDAIERAVDARLLEETADGVRFAHALVREALYAGMLGVRRRALHRRVAEALLATVAPDPDAVAHHFRQAGDPRALDWLMAAGERARRAYAWVTAGDRYEAALALLPEEGQTERRGWLLLRLAALRRYTDTAQAITYLDEAQRLATAAADAPLDALAAYVRGHLRCLANDLERGVAEVAAGADAMGALPPGARARLDALAEAVGLALGGERGLLANWLGMLGRLAEARAVGERVLAAPPPPVAPGRAMLPYGDAHLGLGRVYGLLGEPTAARRTLERARDLFQAAGDHFSLGLVAANALRFVALPYHADDLPWRRRLDEEALAAFGRASGAMSVTFPARTLPLLILEGRWDEAEELGRVSAPNSPGGGYEIIVAPALARVARARGVPEAAWRAIRTAMPESADAPPSGTSFARGLDLYHLAATLALDAGDLDTARAWLAAHDRWLAWSGAVLGRAEGHLGWAAYHRTAGALPLARQHAERALAHASDPRQPLALLAAHRQLGELVTEVGQYADAAGHLTKALALAEACAAPYERTLTLLALAELRAAEGQGEVAGATLAEARAILEPLAAIPALARADALVSRLATPAPPIPGPPPAPFGLTAREAEILRLVAQGLSNTDIADRLSLSRRTVEQHLRNVYDKLGVENRAAATRLAVERGLA